MRRLFLISCLLLAACDSRSTFNYMKKDPHVKPLTEIKANLAFTCAHENIPEASAESDVLFKYARWLQKNNQLKQDKNVDDDIQRLYRIAAENGHYKANINLQNGSMRQRFQLRGAEHLRLSQQLMDAGVATGYYFVGIFLQQGSAGLKQDPEMSLRYYRKAADKGSAEAQYYVGDKLAPSDIAPDVARQMRRCAAEQKHGRAAVALAVNLKNKGIYREAVEVLQMGVAGGYEHAAGRLGDAFRGPSSSNKLDYLGQSEDLERADRYKKIWKILAGYSYANPKVPEINEILPLPPAKLPAWDGKLQWLEERLANVPPEKPSEALIQQLAKAKLLDPTSGRPLPASPDFIREPYRKLTCKSGQACPQSGYWKAEGIVDEIRRFEKGEMMPTLNVQRSHSRFLLADRITVAEENIEWILFGEA
jgi:TPR repeat protein